MSGESQQSNHKFKVSYIKNILISILLTAILFLFASYIGFSMAFSLSKPYLGWNHTPYSLSAKIGFQLLKVNMTIITPFLILFGVMILSQHFFRKNKGIKIYFFPILYVVLSIGFFFLPAQKSAEAILTACLESQYYHKGNYWPPEECLPSSAITFGKSEGVQELFNKCSTLNNEIVKRVCFISIGEHIEKYGQYRFGVKTGVVPEPIAFSFHNAYFKDIPYPQQLKCNTYPSIQLIRDQAQHRECEVINEKYRKKLCEIYGQTTSDIEESYKECLNHLENY